MTDWLTALRRFWFASLRRQVMLSFVSVSGLVLLVTGSIILQQQRDFLHQHSQQHALQLAHVVAVNSVSWMMVNDVAGLQEVLDSVSRGGNVRYALVMARDGHVLAASDTRHIGTHVTDAASRELLAMAEPQARVLHVETDTVHVAEPVLAGKRLLGWVRLGFDTGEISANLRSVERAGLLMMTVSLLATLLVAWALSRRVSGRLQQVVDVANQIHAGERAVRSAISGEDEVAVLAQRQNSMLDELERSERALKARGNALGRAHADLTRFAEVSAHHLMEPSRRLVSYAQYVQHRLAGLPGYKDDPELQQALGYIELDAVHLRTLVHDIQLYLAAGEPRGEVAEQDAGSVLDAVVQRLSTRLHEQGVQLERSPLPPALLDRPRLNDLFSVLLDNALRHGRPLDGQVQRIHISGERDAACSRYRISDNGPGIPAEFRGRVFEIFERLHAGKGGSGIGLSIARRIVESCHGRIWIEETPGGGTTVVFELPWKTEEGLTNKGKAA